MDTILPKRTLVEVLMSSVSGEALRAHFRVKAETDLINRWPFDVLGIAVPQDIDNSMLDTFTYLAERAGIPLVVIQQQDWLRIASTAVEEIKFNEEGCRNG